MSGSGIISEERLRRSRPGLQSCSQLPGIWGMKYQRGFGDSDCTVKYAHPPATFSILALNVNVLGSVHVVNFHDDPGTNPSGNKSGGSLTV